MEPNSQLYSSTAAAARWRERRGGAGGLRGPDRPSCTSCRCGALKGFARARCATDENILLRWRTPNRSLGKVAAHRGRMSSRPEDPCPSRGVTVTHAERHCATRLSFAERSAEPGRHRVLLATLSPPTSNPSPSGPASAQEDSYCAGADPKRPPPPLPFFFLKCSLGLGRAGDLLTLSLHLPVFSPWRQEFLHVFK